MRLCQFAPHHDVNIADGLQQLDQRKVARLQLDATRWATTYAKVLAGKTPTV